MEVKPGYKQTEIGAIPEDWVVAPLGRLVRSVEYGSSAKSERTGAVPVLRMGNLQGGKIDWTDLVYSDDSAEIRKYSLRRGDVLFNRTNTIDLVGKTSIYEGERPAIFAGYLIRVNVTPERLDSRFLNYILNTEFARKHSAKILSVAVGQANINGQKLKTYPIPLPSTLAEQEAIAEALSDADALIKSLEQLVAKKRQLKLGTMQSLLTGRMRLTGFRTKVALKHSAVGDIPEDWRIVPLARLIRSVEYGSSAKSDEKGMMPVLRMGNLQDGKLDWSDLVYTSDAAEIAKYQLRTGDVLFNRTNTTELVGKTSIYKAERPAIFAGYLIRINALPSLLDSQFLNYVLNTELARRHSAKILSVAVGQANINGQKLKTYPIPVPPTKDEQVAIAKAISDMESDIELLDSKITKVRQVKQGMMQKLLTGRIRLV